MAVRERRVFVITNGIPELEFIPASDRESTSASPYGVLTNKIFKYRDGMEGRVLYSWLLDMYGIDALVMEKSDDQTAGRRNCHADAEGNAGAYPTATHEPPKPGQGELF